MTMFMLYPREFESSQIKTGSMNRRYKYDNKYMVDRLTHLKNMSWIIHVD